MSRVFREREVQAPPDADAIDIQALRFVKNWHQYPGIKEALEYRGVNLGEMNEYLLLPEVITSLVELQEKEES